MLTFDQEEYTFHYIPSSVWWLLLATKHIHQLTPGNSVNTENSKPNTFPILIPLLLLLVLACLLLPFVSLFALSPPSSSSLSINFNTLQIRLITTNGNGGEPRQVLIYQPYHPTSSSSFSIIIQLNKTNFKDTEITYGLKATQPAVSRRMAQGLCMCYGKCETVELTKLE